MSSKKHEAEISETKVFAEFSPVKVISPSTVGYPGGGVKASISLAKDGKSGYVLTLRDINDVDDDRCKG